MTSIYRAAWSERQVVAMGSRAHVIAGDAPDELLGWAVDELERLEQSWSRFRPGSELCGLNARAGERVAVTPRLLTAVVHAREAWALTDGAFDPTVLPALEAAGYDRSFHLLALDDAHRAGPATPAPGFGAVEIDAEAGTVRLPPGTRLDLGGIGKGLAADLVAQGLVERGARSALVGIGGDLRTCGEPPSADGWPVPVEHPVDEGAIAFVHPLRAGGLVTSTTRLRAWRRAGCGLHHIIDPRTGAPARGAFVAVIVTARTAWLAETVAKAMIVVGDEHAPRLAARAGVDAWCCDHRGTLHAELHAPGR
jgi:FAD:protein FMN transferase